MPSDSDNTVEFAFEEEYFSDSPYVNMIWQTRSEADGTFRSVAVPTWEMVFATIQGKTILTIKGPETQASNAYCPPDAEFLGIQFKVGTFLQAHPNKTLANTGLDLPDASCHAFQLDSDTWQLPTFDNADTFVNRLIQQGLLTHDPIVDDVLQHRFPDVSQRTLQRRFVHATGMTQATFHQIQRAQHALTLLEQGISILDVVDIAGYADQPHLTRSLKRFMGQTPAQIVAAIPAP